MTKRTNRLDPELEELYEEVRAETIARLKRWKVERDARRAREARRRARLRRLTFGLLGREPLSREQ